MLDSIYSRLGPGERIALSRLAIEHYEKNGHPLRVAIDIAIWGFQTQLGEGGSNPILRTFYYRLLRLLGLGIQPLFVFDGPKKPVIKRNQQCGYNGHSAADALSKQLLKLVGFPFHVAPGEAEAECALLQKEGVVDAVLSEDADTLMFGCGVLLCKWSSEITKGNKEPTHVNMYTAQHIMEMSGLSSNGLILVALMSGGDYDPEGIAGCGPTIAHEAAKAGFADKLLNLAADDEVGLQAWRDSLNHELKTNEGGYFSRRHKSLIVPHDFPQKENLSLYRSPVVSEKEKIQKLSSTIDWDKPIDILGLRRFVADAFQWSSVWGTRKFIRTIAPKLVVYRLRNMSSDSSSASDDLRGKIRQEGMLIKAICGRRIHVVTGGQPELRIAYIPADVVGLDLQEEEQEGEEKADNAAHNAFQPDVLDSDTDNPEEPPKASKWRTHSRYDPNEPEKIWVLESFAKLGVPLMWETWIEDQRKPEIFATRKTRERKRSAKGGIKSGPLDAYVKVLKPGVLRHTPLNSPNHHSKSNDCSKTRQVVPSNDLAESSSPCPTANPLMLAKRPSDTFDMELPPGTRYSALGIYGSEPEDGTSTAILTKTARPLLDAFSITPQKHAPPDSDSSINQNITLRRRRKHKCLTRAHSAPSGVADVIDLVSPEPTSPPNSADSPYTNFPRLSGKNGESRTSEASVMQASQISTILDPEAYTSRQNDEAQKVSRRLEFDTVSSFEEASCSIVEISPTSSAPLFPSHRHEVDVALPRATPSPSKGRRTTGRLIMLRDSLEGKWRNAEPSDRRRRPARVFSNVDVVDLTSTP